MAPNFIDRDLRNAGGFRRSEAMDQDPVPIPPVTGDGANRMARHKDKLSAQVSGAVGEIERLRLRREALERESGELQELAKKQDDYESGKRDIVDKLNRSMILLEKEESQARRMVELLSETRSKFQETVSDLKTINEEIWADENFREQLGRALAKVETAKDMYKRAVSKIEASSWHKTTPKNDIMMESLRDASVPKSFGYWAKVGLAVSLPLMVILVLLFLAYLFLNGFFRVY